MTLIKSEILTNRESLVHEVLVLDFSRLKYQLKRKQNFHSMFLKIFQVSADEEMG